MDEDILIKTAKEQYPILNTLDLNYKYSPLKAPGFLEFWPSDEEGTPEYPRPTEFPLGTIGVEVYDPNTRPIDILGDVVSHHLINTDPHIMKYYEKFQDSLTPRQRFQLQRQYDYATKNEGEQRPYAVWESNVGMPGYFRGYAFQQWDHADEMYTPRQREMFDRMMNYLKEAR